MGLRESGDMEKGEYLFELRQLGQQWRGKWFDVCWGVREGGKGVRLVYERESEACGIYWAIQRCIRKFPAELWGVSVERLGCMVLIVPREFVMGRKGTVRKEVYDGIRARAKRKRGY